MNDSRIAVVVDSSACIPEEALGGLSIPVIPLWLHWNNERFRDGVDIDPPTFYRRLRTSKTLPTSSQPSREEFVSFFRQVSAGADAIVAVLASSRISGTVASAQAAREQLPELSIRVVDSLSISMGMGFVALAAARAAAAGTSLDKVVAVAEDTRDRMHFLFAVDTLEYLHRGGGLEARNGSWARRSRSSPCCISRMDGSNRCSRCGPSARPSPGCWMSRRSDWRGNRWWKQPWQTSILPRKAMPLPNR